MQRVDHSTLVRFSCRIGDLSSGRNSSLRPADGLQKMRPKQGLNVRTAVWFHARTEISLTIAGDSKRRQQKTKLLPGRAKRASPSV
jgi:hypothetical protein